MAVIHKLIFPMHSNVIVLPHWIAENLHRYEVPLSECLNFKKIQSILSMNDLLGIVAAQSFGEMICGSKGVFANANSVICEWMISCTGEDEKAFLERNIAPFENDQITRDSVAVRLFSDDLESSQYPKPYEIYPIQDYGLAVVVYPGFFKQTTDKQLHSAVTRDILKQLYVYEDQSEVAKQPIFRKYLEQLAHQ